MNSTADQQEYDLDTDIMVPNAVADPPDTAKYPDVFNLTRIGGRGGVPVRKVKLEAHDRLVLNEVIFDKDFSRALYEDDDDALDNIPLEPLDVYEVLLLGNLDVIMPICPSFGLARNNARKLQEISKELIKMGIIPAMQFMALRAAMINGQRVVLILDGFLRNYIAINGILDDRTREALTDRLAGVEIRDYFSRFEILYEVVRNHHESLCGADGQLDEELAAELEGIMRALRADFGKS